MTQNVDLKTVEGFGDEWSRFDQSLLSVAELETLFSAYFDVFPWELLDNNAEGFDLGCGSGRWAKLVADRVGTLHCIDPSEAALEVAQKNLLDKRNCIFHHASVDFLPFDDNSMDFGYSLGVLHHIPNPALGLKMCVDKLKPGAPFLVYLYYDFENRPSWFRSVWKMSDVVRRGVSQLPYAVRFGLSQVIAATIYLPLAKASAIVEKFGTNVEHFPLSGYRHRSFYTMRTDALDRFGTRLEQRFSTIEVRQMMERAGLEEIVFSPSVPYWCAVGRKASQPD